MNFWRFGAPEAHLGPQMDGSYDPILVVLSITVACLAGYAAFAVVDRMVATDGARARRWWLLGGATAMGCGVWSMHFTAMTAFSMGMPATYELAWTVISIVPAILGSAAALHFMSRGIRTWRQVQVGGLLLASGIGTMHYTGMEAMQMSAALRYDPLIFVLSIVVAHVLATGALYVRFVVSSQVWTYVRVARSVGAVLMGLAVAGMHYTAMAAAHFYHDPTATLDGAVLSPLTLGASLCGVTSLIMGFTIVGTIVDRRLEEAGERLQRSESWADAILQAAADGILAIDARGTILSFNAAAARIFGYTPSEAIGRDVHTLVPDGIAESGGFAGVASTGTLGVSGGFRETLGRRKDGSLVPVEVGVQTLVRDDGRIVIGSLRDITERKALEGQLIRAQKLESIGQLAAGIAHEINTPTQFIGDNLRFLRDAFADVLPVLARCTTLAQAAGSGSVDAASIRDVGDAVAEADFAYLDVEIPKALDQSLEGVARVAEIVSAMKDFSHPGGKAKGALDLNHVLETILTVSRNEWRYVAEVETAFAPGLPAVAGLGHELGQTFLNIIVNAAHAIADARADDTAPKGTIRITTRALGEVVEVRVEDTGAGIPESIRSRIFDPFFTTKDVGKGTGQGLAIAHNVIVDQHGGTLDVESTVGRGTTFVVRLPVAAGDDEPDAAVEPRLHA
jgi:PAS domain S-box-containing protein